MSDSIIWRDIEAFAIFCVCVANKKGERTQRLVEKLLAPCETGGHKGPFSYLRDLAFFNDGLGLRLRELRFGQYRRLTRALTELVELGIDLTTCTLDDLEAIHGIGPKTSRYFMLRTRPGTRVAALDTHILRWLRDRGHDAPKSTPQSRRRYREVEDQFLAEADALWLDPGALDRAIWDTYSMRGRG